MASIMRPIAMRWLVALALSAVVLSGCASSGGVAPGGAPMSPGSGSVGAAPSDSPSTIPEATDPTMVGWGRVTLSGTVQQGAEPGCLIVQTPAGQIELLNPRPVPKDGDRVEVTGHRVQAMSHCMQGVPFVVERLTIR